MKVSDVMAIVWHPKGSVRFQALPEVMASNRIHAKEKEQGWLILDLAFDVESARAKRLEWYRELKAQDPETEDGTRKTEGIEQKDAKDAKEKGNERRQENGTGHGGSTVGECDGDRDGHGAGVPETGAAERHAV